MNKNWTIIAAAVLAVITATLAIIFRPVRQTGEWELITTGTTSQKAATYSQVTETSTEKASETEPTAETTTVQVNITESVTKLTETSTMHHSSKLVSKLHEIAEKEKEWLSRRETKPTTTESYSMTPSEFRRDGVIYANGYKYTYYSEKVLPGPGLRIPGRHSDGNFVRDENNYICVASKDLPKGTVVDTPFGKGKVYDVCGQSGVIDIYVSW